MRSFPQKGSATRKPHSDEPKLLGRVPRAIRNRNDQQSASATAFSYDLAQVPVQFGGDLQRYGHALVSAPAVQRKCSRCEAEEFDGIRVQPQLQLGAADDAYEREADAIAHRVMATQGSAVRGADARGGALSSVDASPHARAGGPALDATAAELTSGGGSLPEATRHFYEERMGRDFSSVRLHHDDRANQLNQALSARAFTYREHIWLGAREESSPSFTLAHELAHVMQQTFSGGQGTTNSSLAPLAIQRLLVPPGNCVQGIHDRMQDLVKAWCDHPSGRACTPADNCARLLQKIRRNQLCAQHRRSINDTCYDGGDLGHRLAERDARRAQATCMAFFRGKCQPRPVPQPQREPSNEPERQRTRQPETQPQRAPDRDPTTIPAPVPVPLARRIAEWAAETLREGRNVWDAAGEFLRKNPGLAGAIIAAGAAGIVLLLADDATIVGIVDDVLIPLIAALEAAALRVALGF